MTSIDIRQFHQTFFDESYDGLAQIEQLLLAAETRTARSDAEHGSVDPEVLHTAFRVIHSIKGGSGTFGFGRVADFSHVLETLLDDLRTGRRSLDRSLVALLLQSIDCLRSLLAHAQSDTPVEPDVVRDVSARLQALPPVAAPSRPVGAGADSAAAPAAGRRWRLRFAPGRDFFMSGNDPLRLLRELTSVVPARIRTDTTPLPPWNAFDPEQCYVRWDIQTLEPATRRAVEEVFSWVNDAGVLEIAALDNPPDGAHPDHPLPANASATSIRVDAHKMDALVDIVGELVIAQTILQQIASQAGADVAARLQAGLSLLERNMRELQENVMRIRMLPIASVFSRLPRLARDLGEQLGKKIELRISGEGTELDKTVIERISDPILHMVRNSLDHGIEAPDERRANGKPEIGHVSIDAHQRGGYVFVEIRDDGRGLPMAKIRKRAVDRGMVSPTSDLAPDQIADLIFHPGFSTAERVSRVSGRGVGLDVVRTNIHALGGSVDVDSREGHGTRFTLQLPLTLAILDGLGVRACGQTYVVPLACIAESLHLDADRITRLPKGDELFAFRREYIPLLRLSRLFRFPDHVDDLDQGIVLVIEANGRYAGVLIDELLGQQQVVIKSLEAHHRRVEGIAAATILGDGTVAYILDAAALVRAATTLTAMDVGSPVHAGRADAAAPSALPH